MEIIMQRLSPLRRYSLIVIAAMGLTGAVISIYNYITPGSGIDGEAGTLLVLVSSLLILLAALAGAYIRLPSWLGATFRVLLLLGILGTGLAAYFLESTFLLAAMIVALAGWLVQALARNHRRPLAPRNQPIGAR
jgi:hypothetical protein